MKRVITAVNTYGIGNRGADTRRHDQTEARWDRDMPAYKRLRHGGHQPPQIDGCADLEAKATSGFDVETGLRFGPMNDKWVHEGQQEAKESGWDPKSSKNKLKEAVS